MVPVWLVELAPVWPALLDPLEGVVVVEPCPAVSLLEPDGFVAVEEEDWLDGEVLLWLEVWPLELVAVELVFGVEDVADGAWELSVLWPEVLAPCAHAIAVAITATDAVIRNFFMRISSIGSFLRMCCPAFYL